MCQDDGMVECKETLGGFGGFIIHEDGVVATLSLCCEVELPRSALKLLRKIRIGDPIAVVQIGRSAYVRLVGQT
jgi:hypothetical protein